jgi:hypothetical protein
MKVGTKSLLFGAHQFIFHPLTVLLAWIKLYNTLPNWKEIICIFIHDWGYWGCEKIESGKGDFHPELGAKIANFLFGKKYEILCLNHSRSYCKIIESTPSKLCWADKLCVIYLPTNLFIFFTKLSGELQEYRENSAKNGFISLDATNKEWFEYVKKDVIPYVYSMINK